MRVVALMRLFIAGVICRLILVVRADTCTCGDPTPCQHVSGTTCYRMTTRSDFQSVVEAKARLACPSQTMHCSCNCAADTPCRRNSSGTVGCEPTVKLYGEDVCENGAVHCQAVPNANAAPQPVEAAAAPAGATGEVCRCSGLTPCLYDAGLPGAGYCIGAVDGQCPVGTRTCDCGCPTQVPCRHKHSRWCYAKFSHDASGATNMKCPHDAVQCVEANCHCDESAPCHFNDAKSRQSFCLPVVNTKCPPHSTRCGAARAGDAHVPAQSTLASRTGGNQTCDTSAGTWGNETECSRKCGGGTLRQWNNACPNAPPRSVECNTRACQNTDCVVSGWSNWTACSQDCGVGTQYKWPIVTQASRDYGLPCPAPHQRPCRAKRCEAPSTCECDPFANDTAGDSPAVHDPEAPTIDVGIQDRWQSDTSHLGCKAHAYRHDNASQRNFIITVVHPNLDPSATEDEWAGKHHRCAYSEARGACKCCTCQREECFAGDWGNWSICEPFGSGIYVRTRRRREAGTVDITSGQSCADIVVTQRDFYSNHECTERG